MRKIHRRGNPTVVAFLLALLVTCVAAGFRTAELRHVSKLSPQAASATGTRQTGHQLPQNVFDLPSTTSPILTGRAVFPYSVIPGGVQSGAELKSAMTNDPVVQKHYQGVDLPNERSESLVADRLLFVSYRIGNQIFWTKKPVRLHKGEMILTDGHFMARTRCGNRLSEKAEVPTSPQEPLPEALERSLERIIAPAEPGQEPEQFGTWRGEEFFGGEEEAPVAPPVFWEPEYPPIIYPPIIPPPPVPPPPAPTPPPIITPEPSVGGLLLLGLSAGLAVCGLRVAMRSTGG